jgi:plasmid stabilization system protein ParE
MNSYLFQLTDEAREEIDQAVDWYEKQRPGLGDEFFHYLREAFDDLSEAPFLYAPYRTRYRKMNLRRFPYSVIYQVIEESQTVLVIAVLHQKRDSNVLFEE